jgi:enamine deaminase RidA (YjgF/YER057c/UK114 family)
MSQKQYIEVPELEDSSAFGYSQCLRLGNNLYIAGQCGLGPDHEIVSPDFDAQARRALDRISFALRAAGGTMDDITEMTVFVTDIRYGRMFTGLRREYFEPPYPTSAVIGVHALIPMGALVEVQARAVLS